MKNVNLIYRWVVLVVMVIFALQEINGGRFPSMYDRFWRSWSVLATRPIGEIAFGVAILLVALGVLLRNSIAPFVAIPILAYEFVRAMISLLSNGPGAGAAGLSVFSIAWLVRVLRNPDREKQFMQ